MSPEEFIHNPEQQDKVRSALRALTVESAHDLLDKPVPWGDATALDRVVREYRQALQACLHELIRVDQ
jgi:hypothetical protein